jgi:hypothetical protein
MEGKDYQTPKKPLVRNRDKDEDMDKDMDKDMSVNGFTPSPSRKPSLPVILSPPAPKKLTHRDDEKLPPADNKTRVVRNINFETEEKEIEEAQRKTKNRIRYCTVFASRINRFYDDFITKLIEPCAELIVKEDYKPQISKTEFMQTVMDIMHHELQFGQDLYPYLIKIYDVVVNSGALERALECEHDVTLIKNIHEIKSYLPILSKIIKCLKIELDTRAPVFVKSGIQDMFYEDIEEPDEKDYYQKYLKYKNKYLELRKKFPK